ncbi:hypothetical protein ALI44B_10110 [Leifsonia sp. ALI-44-B]|nr:hypothetical protein ALI44B_10110 [Leifsonia sp. ALI-44-B]
MISNRQRVWAWLPGATEPTAVGTVRVDPTGRALEFVYASSYLARDDAITLSPDMPLGNDIVSPDGGMLMPATLRDAMPDAWGRRVLAARASEELDAEADPHAHMELAFMRSSGTDRFGGLDFQDDHVSWVPRETTATLDELHEAADRIEEGRPLSRDLEAALEHGTTIGGARPKALIRDGGDHYIAKFSSLTDTLPVVQAEGAAMTLARFAGLPVADVTVTRSLGKQVLLVRRFDRTPKGGRRLIVSALTLARLDEMYARYATYPGLLERLREHGPDVDPGPGLFDRIAFNMMISNSDDHARNHAAFWDGRALSLTPAYDLAPNARSGETASQAMAYSVEEGRPGERTSSLKRLEKHSGRYGLDQKTARSRIDGMVAVINDRWDEARDVAMLTNTQAKALWGRQFLNPGIFYD